jgi:hypothetical protein
LEDVKNQDENKVQIEAEVTTSQKTIETSPEVRSTTIDTSLRKSTTTEISNEENTSTMSAQISTFERTSTKSSKPTIQRRRRTRKTLAKDTSTQSPSTEFTTERSKIAFFLCLLKN